MQPRRVFGDQSPVPTIGRAPDVARRRLEGVEPSPENPKPVPENHFALGISWLPRSGACFLHPIGPWALATVSQCDREDREIEEDAHRFHVFLARIQESVTGKRAVSGQPTGELTDPPE